MRHGRPWSIERAELVVAAACSRLFHVFRPHRAAFPSGRQLSSRTLEPDLRWAYELGLDTLLPYLKVPLPPHAWPSMARA